MNIEAMRLLDEKFGPWHLYAGTQLISRAKAGFVSALIDKGGCTSLCGGSMKIHNTFEEAKARCDAELLRSIIDPIVDPRLCAWRHSTIAGFDVRHGIGLNASVWKLGDKWGFNAGGYPDHSGYTGSIDDAKLAADYALYRQIIAKEKAPSGALFNDGFEKVEGPPRPPEANTFDRLGKKIEEISWIQSCEIKDLGPLNVAPYSGGPFEIIITPIAGKKTAKWGEIVELERAIKANAPPHARWRGTHCTVLNSEIRWSYAAPKEEKIEEKITLEEWGLYPSGGHVRRCRREGPVRTREGDAIRIIERNKEKGGITARFWYPGCASKVVGIKSCGWSWADRRYLTQLWEAWALHEETRKMTK